MMGRLFGKKVDPAEQAKEWKRKVRGEVRGLDRSIQKLEREEGKVVKEIKQLAKQGASRAAAVRILAKQVVQVRNTKNRLYEGRAHLNSVSMQIQQQLSMIKVAGCMQSSTEIMAAVGKLVQIPEVAATMTDLAREMERAGLVEEIVTDGLETLDPDGIESEVDAQVDLVVSEITAGLLTGAVDAPTAMPAQEEAEAEEGKQEEEGAMDEMKARLASL